MPSVASYLPVVALLASLQTISAAQVHSLGQGGQCLQVSGTPSNGAAVTLGSCNGNNANSGTATGQQWIISPGNNAGVQLYGSNFCLDGQADEAGRETVVYPCIGNAAQTFYLTGDNRIAITGGTQCLTSASNGLENEDCAPNVAAQAFSPTLLFDTDTVSSSAVGIGAPATSGASSAASSASSAASSASSAASAATASASSVASAASASATGAASSAASQGSTAASAASSGAQSATSSAASAASSSASSVASGASSGASAATSAVASGATSLASGATSVVSAATSGVESLGSAVGSGVSSVAGAATSAVGGTGGALNVKQIAAGFWVAIGVVVGAAVVA